MIKIDKTLIIYSNIRNVRTFTSGVVVKKSNDDAYDL